MASPGMKRMMKEISMLEKEPVAYCHAAHDPKNIYSWTYRVSYKSEIFKARKHLHLGIYYIHAIDLCDFTLYIIRGPSNSVFEGGVYVGAFDLPQNWPFSPPKIRMYTPNGRFKHEGDICTTFSIYHPNMWNTSWTVRALCSGMLSFMQDLKETQHIGGIPHSSMNAAKFKKLAEGSFEYSLKNVPKFKELFPNLVQELTELRQNKKWCLVSKEYLPSQQVNNLKPIVCSRRQKNELKTLEDKHGNNCSINKNGQDITIEDEFNGVKYDVKFNIDENYPFTCPNVSFPCIDKWRVSTGIESERVAKKEFCKKVSEIFESKSSFIPKSSSWVKRLNEKWTPECSIICCYEIIQNLIHS